MIYKIFKIIKLLMIFLRKDQLIKDSSQYKLNNRLAKDSIINFLVNFYFENIKITFVFVTLIIIMYFT